MFGPFCQSEMEDIMKGPFQSSPLIIDAQPQPNGALDKIHICRPMSKHDKLHLSTNDYVDSSKFPTCFRSVSEVSKIVSPLFDFLSPHPKTLCYLLFSLHTSMPFCCMHPFSFVVCIHAFCCMHSCPFVACTHTFCGVHPCFLLCASMPFHCMHPCFLHMHSCFSSCVFMFIHI